MAIRDELQDVQRQLLSSTDQHGKQVEELRKSLEDERQRLRSELQESEQSRNSTRQQFEGLKIFDDGRVRELERMIDELRRQGQQQRIIGEFRQQEQQKLIDDLRRQQQQQQQQQRRRGWARPASQPTAAPQHTVPTVIAPAYGSSVHHRNSTSSLTVVDKTSYANGSWTQISDGHKFIMPGSGNSGLLRFRSSNGEEVGVAVGDHNWVRWCDIVTGFGSRESCHSRMRSITTAQIRGIIINYGSRQLLAVQDRVGERRCRLLSV